MNITVWNEHCHEKIEARVREVHPQGLHETVAQIVRQVEGAQVTTATLDEPQAGLPDVVLNNTDVLIWWGHMAHEKVPDEVVERVCRRVLKGMGLIVLHSGHHSKVFRRLMGTTCDLRWRDDTYERIFTINPSHPIAQGLPEHFEMGKEECYGEYFDIPQPDEVIFQAWYDIGEVFRAGCTWRRGFGKIFYFQPGHESNHSFENPYVQQIIQNACRWVAPTAWRTVDGAPQILETLEELRKKS